MTLKTALENVYIIFLNKDFSVNIASISVNFLGDVLYEGSDAQTSYLGLSHLTGLSLENYVFTSIYV